MDLDPRIGSRVIVNAFHYRGLCTNRVCLCPWVTDHRVGPEQEEVIARSEGIVSLGPVDPQAIVIKFTTLVENVNQCTARAGQPNLVGVQTQVTVEVQSVWAKAVATGLLAGTFQQSVVATASVTFPGKVGVKLVVIATALHRCRATNRFHVNVIFTFTGIQFHFAAGGEYFHDVVSGGGGDNRLDGSRSVDRYLLVASAGNQVQVFHATVGDPCRGHLQTADPVSRDSANIIIVIPGIIDVERVVAGLGCNDQLGIQFIDRLRAVVDVNDVSAVTGTKRGHARD